jgi:hypothetical protein
MSGAAGRHSAMTDFDGECQWLVDRKITSPEVVEAGRNW